MSIRATAAAAALVLAAGAAQAGDPAGVWATEKNDEGRYITVEVKLCGDKYCGYIVDGYLPDGSTNPDYEHRGRQMIFDMAADGENKWDDGEIWAPDDDKNYNASMELKGDVLTVEGCVFIICRGQEWTRAD